MSPLDHHLIAFCIHKCISLELCVQMLQPQEAELQPRPQQASLLWTLVRSGRMWLLRRAFESSSLVMSARHSSRLKCVCELCSFIQAHSCRPLVRLSFSITCVYRHKIRKRKAALFPLRLACGGVFALSCCCPAAARSCRRLVSSWLCSCAVLAWLFPSVPWPLPPAQADVVMPA